MNGGGLGVGGKGTVTGAPPTGRLPGYTNEFMALLTGEGASELS